MVIELKKDAVAEVVLNNLYKLTQMQVSFGVQLLAIVQNQPRTLTLKQTLEEFLAYRREVVTRRSLFLLRKAEGRAHILEGLKIALSNLDAVIKLIRASKDPKEAKEGLVKKFALSEIQAQAILDMRLQRLTGLEREKILEELKEVQKEIARLKRILAEEKELLRVIAEEFREIREAYADVRRSQIVPEVRELGIEDLLTLSSGERISAILPVREFTEGKFVFMATAKGVVKKTDLMEFSRPRSGGIIALGLNDGDSLIATEITGGDDDIFLPTRQGMSIRFREDDVRAVGRTAVGVRGIALEEGDEVVGMEILRPQGTMLTVTEKGFGKRSAVEEYRVQSRGGKVVITLKVTEKTGSVLGVAQVSEEDDVMLVTDGGKIIRMPVAEIRVSGRNTQGVRLIGMEEDEHVASLARLAEKEE